MRRIAFLVVAGLLVGPSILAAPRGAAQDAGAIDQPPVITDVHVAGEPVRHRAVNDATVTLTIKGEGFQPGDYVLLRRAAHEPMQADDILMKPIATNAIAGGVVVDDPGAETFVSSRELQAVFDLADADSRTSRNAPAAPGAWDLVVRRAATSVSAVCRERPGPDVGPCFLVEAAGAPVVTVPSAPAPVVVAQGRYGLSIDVQGDNLSIGTRVDLGPISDASANAQYSRRDTIRVGPVSVPRDAPLGRHDIVVTAPDGAQAVCAGCLVIEAGPPAVPAPTLHEAGRGEGLVEVGEFSEPLIFPATGEEFEIPGPTGAVDPDVGIALVGHTNWNLPMLLYDLERIRIADASPQWGSSDGGDVSIAADTLVLDTRRRVAYAPVGYPESRFAVAPCGPSRKTGRLRGFSYAGTDGSLRLRLPFTAPLPCTGPGGSVPFHSLGGAYHEPSDSAYLAGVPGQEWWRELVKAGGALSSFAGRWDEDRGQALLVRQMRIDGPDVAPRAGPPARFELEWEVDLRHAGCGRREAGIHYLPFVTRIGDSVLAYCFDSRPYKNMATGAQGYLITIPLVEGPDGVMRPETRGEPVPDPLGPPESVVNFAYSRTPTLPGKVTPFVDEVTGRLLLVTDDLVNGSAVWSFDPARQRFVGVSTGGVVDQPGGNTSVGFDPVTGRVYLLTVDGIVVFETRGELGGGRLFPVVVNEERVNAYAQNPRFAVLPRPEGARLFVGVKGRVAVIEDRIPVPDPPLDPDPDRLTTQIDEEPGVTEVETLGQGTATGARLITVGGAGSLVNSNDPTCYFNPPDPRSPEDVAEDPQSDWGAVPSLTDGSCAVDHALTPGSRSLELGATEAEAGTAIGAYARGAPADSTDHATDADMRRPTECLAATPDEVHGWTFGFPLGDHNPSSEWIQAASDGWRQGQEEFNRRRSELWNGGEFQEGKQQFMEGDPDDSDDGYTGRCAAFWEAASASGVDLRAGSSGAPGEGFVLPAAECTGDAAEAALPAGSDDSAAPGSARAMCEASRPSASASASAFGHGVAIPHGDGVGAVSVESVGSTTTSGRTPEGQVTMAVAHATDVRIGPLAIAEVRTVAIARAKGRTGTATTDLERRWCGVVLPGVIDHEGCLDPDDPENAEQMSALIREVNAATLQRVQLSLPRANGTDNGAGAAGKGRATPGGYEAVITKDPGQRQGDRAVNDDESFTVPGLQVVVYNDSSAGRSRVIVQVAGVHAEARYGITLLPRFSGFEGSFSAGTSAEGTPATRRVIPGTRQLPSAATVIEGGGFEELFSTTSPLPENPVRRFLGFLPEALEDLWRLFVQHPLEFLLLFFVFSLLATPAYLAYRRRTFAGVLSR